MGMREIKAVYGRSLSSRSAVNAAIRAEMVGGDDLLDALERVDRLVQRLRDRQLAGVDEAQAAMDRLQSLRDIMANIVIERYSQPG